MAELMNYAKSTRFTPREKLALPTDNDARRRVRPLRCDMSQGRGDIGLLSSGNLLSCDTSVVQ